MASLVRSTDGDENWILAEVVQYLPSSGRYEVDDIDEEQKERHILSRRRVVPLPLMRANPETNPDGLFPKGATGEKYYCAFTFSFFLFDDSDLVYSHGSLSSNDLLLQGSHQPASVDGDRRVPSPV